LAGERTRDGLTAAKGAKSPPPIRFRRKTPAHGAFRARIRMADPIWREISVGQSAGRAGLGAGRAGLGAGRAGLGAGRAGLGAGQADLGADAGGAQVTDRARAHPLRARSRTLSMLQFRRAPGDGLGDQDHPDRDLPSLAPLAPLTLGL